MSLEKFKGESRRGKEIPSVGNSRLRLPSRANLSLDEHQSGSFLVRCFSSFDLQSTLELLASLNGEEHAIPLLTNVDHSFEIIIPPMSLVNVTGERGFHFHSLRDSSIERKSLLLIHLSI
jgi:hypothetical protein